MVKVLFVCMGNICRSPIAEGVFRQFVDEQELSEQIHMDSAGTLSSHAGEAPDPRAQQAAQRRGIDIQKQRARQVTRADLESYDYVIAMDRQNLNYLQSLVGVGDGQALSEKLHLLLDFAPNVDAREVPDPYYGGNSGFEFVLDLVEHASQGLLADIKQHFPSVHDK